MATGAQPGRARYRAGSVHMPAGAAPKRRHTTSRSRVIAPLVGMTTVAVLSGIVAIALTQFRGGFTDSVPVTVISDRAGLVMNPGAKVKLHGAQVGTVASIEDLATGQSAIHLAIEPDRLRVIPANVLVDIASTSVFGAKFVQLLPPDHPDPGSLHAGQVLDAKHVTVEVNTVFDELNSVLSKIDPAKLNETLGAIETAFNARGDRIGQALRDLNTFLAKIDPSLPSLKHELQVAPTVLRTYSDSAADLVTIVGNATKLSNTIVSEQQNLDMLLVSTIGLADIGNEVVGGNRQALTRMLHLLVPTTDLTNEYHSALTCGLTGMIPLANQPPDPNPGFTVMAGLSWGVERYRYPSNLPKVAAKGGPQCKDELPVPFDTFPPYLVTDVGANPFAYGNPTNMGNSDLLKQLLYGPLDGPPRNSAQIGQPG